MEEADSGGYWASPGGEQCGGSPADVQDHGRPLAWPHAPAPLGVPGVLLTGSVLSPGRRRPLPPEAVRLQARQPRLRPRHAAAPQRPRPPAPSAPPGPGPPAPPLLSAHGLEYSAGDVQWRPEVRLAAPRPLPAAPGPHEAGLGVAPEAVAGLCRASSSLRGGLVKYNNWTHDMMAIF